MVKVEKRIRQVVVMEMEDHAAEQLAADIFYLLECTKDLAGIVPQGSIFAADDCRKRLGEFVGSLKLKRRRED